jgi:Mg2+/Co2+ transporter CorB
MVSLSFTALGVAAIVVLVGFSAFFSSSESAIFTLPEVWISEQDAATDQRVATLQELRSDPHRLLVTILVGNNVVNMAIASITTALLIEAFPSGSAVTLSTILASFVVLVFGEIVPKSYGLGHAREWALRVVTPLSVVERVLYPLVVVFDFLTRRLNAVIGGDTGIEKPYLEE